MKVLHVTPSFARRDGGPSETLRGLVPELEKLGVDVHTLTTDKGVDDSDRDFAAKSNVTIVRARQPRSWNFAPGIVAPLWKRARDYDVVHIHSVNSFTTTVAMVVARLRRVPYVLEPHGAFDAYHMREGRSKKRFYNSVVDRFGFGGLSGVLTSSRRERTDAAEVLAAVNFELPLGVDERLFELDRRSAPTTSALFLGRIAKKKRLDLVLRGLALMDPQHRPRLVVAGPIGDDIDYDPQGLAESLGVSDSVDFVGPVDAARRADLLSSSDFFVLPSEDESFGVAVAEAMAAGCCVVASAEVGIAEEAEQNGALVLTRLDPHHLGEVLTGLVGEPRRAESVGARGRAYARERFLWSNSARHAFDAYSSVSG